MTKAVLVLSLLLVPSLVRAELITGGITFGGAIGAVNFLTTDVLEPLNNQALVLCATIDNCDGSYASLTGVILADYNDVTIPFVGGELWSFSFAGLDYFFNLDSIDSVTRGANGIILTGTGTVGITGFEDTPAIWSLSANSTNRFAFSSTTDVNEVAEPGSMLLFSVGIAVFAWKLRNPISFK